MKPIVFQFWDTTPLPSEIVLLINTWDAVNPDFDHRVYNDATSAEFISEHIGSAALDAYRACGVAAMKADLFRYCALFTFGGVYVDADTRYMGNLLDLYNTCRRGLLFRRQKNVANDFIIVKNPQDDLIKYTLDTAINNISSRISNNVWEVTGPGIMTSLWRKSEGNINNSLFRDFSVVEERELRTVVGFDWSLQYKKNPGHWVSAMTLHSIFSNSD